MDDRDLLHIAENSSPAVKALLMAIIKKDRMEVLEKAKALTAIEARL